MGAANPTFEGIDMTPLSNHDKDEIARIVAGTMKTVFQEDHPCRFRAEEIATIRSFAEWWRSTGPNMQEFTEWWHVNGDVVRNFIKFWDRTRTAWWMMTWGIMGTALIYIAVMIFEHFGKNIVPLIK